MNKCLSFILLSLCPFTIAADDTGDQLDERLSPVIEACADDVIDYSAFPSVRLDRNKVILNNDDWSALAAKYRSALSGDSLFTVVYLGDSHVQADFGGAVLRRRLSQERSAGRGIIIPFKLAGTNEPLDYSFSLETPYTASKLMRLPWKTEMPFTGIGLKPDATDFTFEISSDTPARFLRLHCCGASVEVKELQGDGTDEDFMAYSDDDGLLCLSMARSSSNFRIRLSSECQPVIGGVELRSDSVGVVSHSIGNNGATFCDYAGIESFGPGLSSLHPDLVVVALGTNEAFGRIGMDSLRSNMDRLLNNIHEYNPNAKVLLVGPADCYRKIRKYSGRRKRRRTVQVVNTKAAEVARTMRLFAEERGVPYYNQYAVAGSALSQRQSRILSRDGVHYTSTGYRLWGNLLSDAILDVLNRE